MRITLSGTLKYFLDQEGEGGRWGWGQGLMFFTQTIFASKKSLVIFSYTPNSLRYFPLYQVGLERL